MSATVTTVTGVIRISRMTEETQICLSVAACQVSNRQKQKHVRRKTFYDTDDVLLKCFNQKCCVSIQKPQRETSDMHKKCTCM